MGVESHNKNEADLDPSPFDVHSERALRLLFDSVLLRMGMVEMDEQGDFEYLHVNAAHAHFIGIPPEQMRGRKLSELTSPAMLDVWRSRYREALETGQPVSFEFSGVRRKGQ